MFLVSFTVALVTGRLIGRVAMRVLLGLAIVAAAGGLASMAHLTATSTWLVLLPGLILVGIGLGVTSTGALPRQRFRRWSRPAPGWPPAW
jgi:fucose permease